jgi:hypothetical protein
MVAASPNKISYDMRPLGMVRQQLAVYSFYVLFCLGCRRPDWRLFRVGFVLARNG